MTQSPLVTLVDSDPQGLATLTYSFEIEQFRVVGSSDLGMAGELVRSTGARVVVLSLRPPEEAGLQLIVEVAQMGTAHGPPVIVLGPPESRQAALQAGAADYIDTPAFVRDAVILSRLRLLTRPTARPGDGAAEMSGSLDAVHGLFALMRTMAAAQRSGVLQLARGNRKAEVKFTEGAVTSAQVRGLQAFPALHQLLLWSGAQLNLKLRDVPKRPQFSATGTEILEECERFLRDVHHAVHQFGASFDAVFTRDARQGGSHAAPVPEEVAPVARLFDGARTLSEVIEESPFRIFDTLRVVKRLIDGGMMIARAGGSGPPGAGAGRAAPATAVPRARSKSGPQVVAAKPAQPHDLDALLQDRRAAAAGDRRKTVRRTPSGFAKPAAKAAPAPIPLVTKKTPSGAVAAGEIRSPRAMQPAPARPLPAARHEPSVQITIDAPTLSLDVRVPTGAFPMTDGPAAPAPAAAPAPHPAPLSARQPAAPVRLKKVTKPPGAGAPAAAATAFNALEADFFAREADLYKDQSPDTFEDLEHGSEGRRRPRTATPRGTKKR